MRYIVLKKVLDHGASELLLEKIWNEVFFSGIVLWKTIVKIFESKVEYKKNH